MIKINLLPHEFGKAQRPKRSLRLDIPKLGPKLKKLSVYLLSVLAGLHILLGLSIFLKTVSLKKLNAKWQRLQPSRAEVERLNKEIAELEKIIMPIRQLVAKRIIWSKELNQLSDSMVPGVWLTKLFIQSNQVRDAKDNEYVRVLNLEGYAASLYGDETVLVAKFIKAMQDNKEFFKYFRELKMGPMEKATLENAAVMNFKIFCFFKKD